MRFLTYIALVLACASMSSSRDIAGPKGDSSGGPKRVAVMVPCSPYLAISLKQQMIENLRRLPEANPELALEIFVDSGPLAMQASDERPLSKTARLRNRMLDAVNVSAFDYLLWIDADVVEYPATLPSLLISANPGGVTAPLVLIEEPGPEGANQFYDTTAFTLRGKAGVDQDNNLPYVVGRSINKFPPYIPAHSRQQLGNNSDLILVDGVGTVYVLPARVFTDSSSRYVDHRALTEHWSVVSRAHAMGLPVALHMGVTVRHANLPEYGESWHSNE